MTDIQDYTSEIQTSSEVGQTKPDWTEPETNANVSSDVELMPNVYDDDSCLLIRAMSPMCSATEDDSNTVEDPLRNSFYSSDKKSNLDYQTPACDAVIDAGVDTASVLERDTFLDPKIEEHDPNQESISLPKEHVFRIAIEDDISSSDANKSDDQIYYLPLAIGASGGNPESENLDFNKLSGLGETAQSDNILRDLGKPLSQMAGSTQSAASISNESVSTNGSRTTSHTENTTMSGSTNTSSFLTCKSTLVTDSMLKTGTIPESITQQFNQIAKLNKSSLRSRRTVRTTTTRVTPGHLICTPASTSAKSDKAVRDSLSDRLGISAVGPGTSQSTSAIPIFNTRAQDVQSSEGSPQSSSLFANPNPKRPIHARFHSDETKPMTDFESPTGWYSNPCSGDQISPSTTTAEFVTAAHITTTCTTTTTTVTRQPITYVRSVTAERLPVFIRSGGSGVVNAGVLRSKSAAGTISANRRGKSDQIHSTDEEILDHDNVAVEDAHRSLPDSSVESQCHSSGHTGSEEGSTSSLPSLGTAGSSSTSAAATLEIQSVVPAASDPNLPRDSAKESTAATVSSVTKSEGSALPGSDSVDEQVRLSDNSYVTLLKRRHIMKELIQVEKEYVGALATLVNSYMIPLKQERILDDQQVDVIFFKISELFNYHLSFLNTLQMWEMTNTVGDKLLDMFSREAVAICYCSFVENFPNSEKTLEACWNTKSSFQKFCEQKLRTLRSKLPLKALLVQPVQRIPRYELLVKRLIEYTPTNFSDSALLIEARNAIHRLAVRVNTVQADGQDESMMDGIKLLARLLAPATITPNRVYIRHDIVSLEDRKDPVCIFMFTDQIVFTVAKRRGTQTVKKPIFLRLQSPKGVETIENIKYKIFHRLGIEAIDFEPCDGNESDHLVQHRELRDKKDLTLLAEIENISAKLDYRHHDLDTVVRNLYQSVQQELEDLRTARCASTPMPKHLSVFSATTKEGIERYELTFPSGEKRKDWERTVMELKRQLSSVKRTSHFLGSLEVPRTLSGIQLSCSAVVEFACLTKTTVRDVWICASDGYTGYICLLSLHPRPMIYLNTPLAGCNSRITCICAVPGSPVPNTRRISCIHGSMNVRSKPSSLSAQRITKPRLSLSKSDETIELTGMENKDRSKSENTVHSTKITSVEEHQRSPGPDEHETNSVRKYSSSQLDDDSETLCYVHTHTSNSALTTPPDTPTLPEANEVVDTPQVSESEQKEQSKLGAPGLDSRQSELSYFAREAKCPSEPFLQEAGATDNPVTDGAGADEPEPQISDYSDSSDISDGENEAQDETSSSQTTQTTSKESSNEAAADLHVSPRNQKGIRLFDPHRPTMWLGTEDGTIYIFHADDNIKTSRQRQQLKLPSGINSILHLDVRLFVACTNGNFFVYDRNSEGQWDMDSPRVLHLAPDHDSQIVVRRMLAVAGNVWCAAHRFVYVLNSVTLKVELSFPLNGNPADPRGIQLMAYGNQTVWLATDNSPRVSVYHATTGEFLMEIDLKPIVIQSLRNCDEIIMRHKEACLRITCLTVCKDLLWAGTSAGVIVTVAIPRVTHNSTKQSMEPPQLEVLKRGHIGHVRFLVSLESAVEPGTSLIPERPRISLSPMHESVTTKFDFGQKELSADPLSSNSGIEKAETSSESRPTSYGEERRRSVHSDAVSSTLPIRSPQPPPRPKPPNVANIQHAMKSEQSPMSESSPSDVFQPRENRLSLSQSHRHYLLGVRRASVNPYSTIATQVQVISGGEGLEEFSTSEHISSPPEVNPSENLGDDDSTNQILIWDVH
ncbi:Rho guanine nucleotide exchange factor 17 [Fasciola hepatica]|uniref:Rho guanine nucleotide exchange factor 17 n=1 Tax=Fasciola hepatica TaxID=6192 RepID=A0A4E0RT54_FASHE|nr:Rho guanine nucleotide exchange factor 17 [Fasciola hepatica]